jgi:tetraacyldisaccharide 4'-kinase
VSVLLPLSWIYGAGVAIHRRARMVDAPASPDPRIISIGNLEAGGSGKTPLAMWMLSRAVARGTACAYVSRGYGGRTVSRRAVTCVLSDNAAPSSLANLRVLARAHPALSREVGDEGALVCERAPGASAFFCADKVRAVEAAATSGIDLIVLDDAFQSWRVPRHTDIVLLDAERPLDGGHLLPAGRLREKPDALARADAIVFNGAATPADVEAGRHHVRRYLREDVAVAGIARTLMLVSARGATTMPPSSVVAVCAIARPDAFKRSLEQTGMRVATMVTFRDHHRYTPADVSRIDECARRENAPVVTTEKDWVKLRHLALARDVWVARLEVSLVGDPLPQ